MKRFTQFTRFTRFPERVISIREYGARPHSEVHMDVRNGVKPTSQRPIYGNGPVVVTMRDGKKLDPPDVIFPEAS
jgi:hypothetical protein